MPTVHRKSYVGVRSSSSAQLLLYFDVDLMEYLEGMIDDSLVRHPETVIAFGNDLNCNNYSMVDFPTRGNVCLDKCLTNSRDLFST